MYYAQLKSFLKSFLNTSWKCGICSLHSLVYISSTDAVKSRTWKPRLTFYEKLARKVYPFPQLIILQSGIFFHLHELKLLSLFFSFMLLPVVCIYRSPYFHIYFHCVPARRLCDPHAHFPTFILDSSPHSSPAHGASFITSSHYPLSY